MDDEIEIDDAPGAGPPASTNETVVMSDEGAYQHSDDTTTYELCGAGVLPFRIRGDGEIVFLLGKERIAKGWQSSGKLSAFEGGNKDGESAAENAVREFREESLSVLFRDDHDELVAQLLRNDYALHVCVRESRSRQQHSTFVKMFEWSQELVETFERRRALLESVDTASVYVKRLEQQFKMGSLPFVLVGATVGMDCIAKAEHGATGENSKFVTGVVCDLQSARMVAAGDDDDAALIIRCTVNAETEKSERIEIRIPISDRSECADCEFIGNADPCGEDAPLTFTSSLPCTAALVEIYLQLLQAYQSLNRLVLEVPLEIAEDALVLQCASKMSSHVVSASVKREWMEKISIVEMTLDELRGASPSLFRPYFMYVLQATFEAFAMPKKPIT